MDIRAQIKAYAVKLYTGIRKNAVKLYTRLRNSGPVLRAEAYTLEQERRLFSFTKNIESDPRTKNRFLLLFISLLLILDFAMFSLHTNKGLFDIFPSFPSLSGKKDRDVYLPDIDGKNIIREKRKILVVNDREQFVRDLFKIVVKGSIYENTSVAVPVNTYIRKVWFHDTVCIIDLGLATINADAVPLPGTEGLFRKALEKTITENLDSVKSVVLLERGIPDRALWEFTEDASRN
jgi:hypothetical protein